MKKLFGLLKGLAIAVVALAILGVVFGGSKEEKKFASDQGSVEVAADESDEGQQDAADQADSKQEAEQKQEEAPAEPKEKYSITDEQLDTSNPYSATITGVLTNNTNDDLTYLQVEYNLYDHDGNQIGSALDNINNLKAGGTWKFEAGTLKSPDEIGSFELADVTGW